MSERYECKKKKNVTFVGFWVFLHLFIPQLPSLSKGLLFLNAPDKGMIKGLLVPSCYQHLFIVM